MSEPTFSFVIHQKNIKKGTKLLHERIAIHCVSNKAITKRHTTMIVQAIYAALSHPDFNRMIREELKKKS